MDVRGARICTKTMSKSSQVKQGGTKSASSKNKDDMAQLKEEIKQLKSERKDQTSTITGLKKRVKKLESDLTKAKHGLESTAPEFLDMISGVSRESYEKKMIQLEEENQRLRSRHNGEENGNKEEMAQLKEEIKQLTSERKVQASTITDLKKTATKLESDLTEAKHGNEEEIAKMRKNIQKLTSDRDKFEMEKNELVKRNQEILKQLNNKPKRNQSTVSTQGTDNEQDKRETDKLKENLQKHIDELKQSKQDGEKLKEELEKLKRENKDLIAENNTFENLKEDIKRVTEDNVSLRGKYAAENTKTEGDMETKDDAVKLEDINVQLRKVKEEKDDLIAQNNESNKERIKLQRENTSLEEDKNKQGITISELQTKIEDLKRNLEESQLEMKRMEKEIGRLKTQNADSSKKDISRLQRENASLVNDLTKQETEISKLNKQMEDFDREMKTKEEKIEQLTRQLESRGQKKENKKGEKSSSAEKISRLEGEVEGLRNRLSKIAGAQLVDNNPAIADLSDPNRPLSLGEKFSELYDNEWTDAMEELSDSSDERAVIKQLLEIVVESYQFCCEESDKFMDRINETMEMFSGNLVSEMPKEISKTNKDFRKSLAVHCVYHLQEEFTNKNSIGNIGKKTKDYMKKCVQVCWFMTVQDPKVVIKYKVTGQFDEDRFKAYTKKGKQVDYLVWPALYLHEGGPVISKGVAQGK